MADRLTQLQDVVNQLADHFCNSIGILQQCAQSSPFPGFERPGNKSPTEAPQEDYAVLFSKLIARTAKDIDVVIDSLPSEESYMELQLASLRRLEVENQDSAHKLEGVVHKGELLLEQTQQALHDIAQSQLKSQALETQYSDDDTGRAACSDDDGNVPQQSRNKERTLPLNDIETTPLHDTEEKMEVQFRRVHIEPDKLDTQPQPTFSFWD